MNNPADTPIVRVNPRERMDAYGQLLNATVRLRAIMHNRPNDVTPAQHRATDTRVGEAEAIWDANLRECGLLDPNEFINEINSYHDERRIVATLDNGDQIEVQL